MPITDQGTITGIVTDVEFTALDNIFFYDIASNGVDYYSVEDEELLAKDDNLFYDITINGIIYRADEVFYPLAYDDLDFYNIVDNGGVRRIMLSNIPPFSVNNVYKEIILPPNDVIRTTISGTVEEDTVASAGKIVRLYHKESGKLVEESVTNGSGQFSFNLAVVGAEYYIIAFDDSGSPLTNAAVIDNHVVS